MRRALFAVLVVMPFVLQAQEGKSALQRELEYDLMAPCCYGGPVAEHGSSEATQIKAQIGQLLGEGRSKEEILDMYVAIYGERILSRPRAAGFNLLAYLMPPIFLLVGGLFLVYIINQMKSAPLARPVNAKKSYSEEFFNKVQREMEDLGI